MVYMCIFVCFFLLLLVRHFVKQFRDALAIMASSDDLAQNSSDINHLDLFAQLLMLALWNSIRHHQFLQAALLNVLDRLAGQDPMSDDGKDSGGTRFGEMGGGETDGSACVGHVVYENGDFVGDVSDEDHSGDFVCSLALLVE